MPHSRDRAKDLTSNTEVPSMRDLRGITILETEREIMEVAEGQPWLRRHFNQATRGETREEREKGLANLVSALIIRRAMLISEDLVVEILTKPRSFWVAKSEES